MWIAEIKWTFVVLASHHFANFQGSKYKSLVFWPWQLFTKEQDFQEQKSFQETLLFFYAKSQDPFMRTEQVNIATLPKLNFLETSNRFLEILLKNSNFISGHLTWNLIIMIHENLLKSQLFTKEKKSGLKNARTLRIFARSRKNSTQPTESSRPGVQSKSWETAQASSDRPSKPIPVKPQQNRASFWVSQLSWFQFKVLFFADLGRH